MRDRWLEFCQRIDSEKAEAACSIYDDDLEPLYSEPHRRYHNFSHITHCLDELEQVRHMLECPDAVEMAIWFHDIWYDTRAKDNEEISAAIAYRRSKTLGLPDDFAGKVFGLILATKHDTLPEDSDTQFLVDIDLSSLGISLSVFAENSQGIREEYAWVPQEEFERKRVEFLQGFLDRPHVYFTAFFQEKYEAQARANLQQVIG